jgi:acetoin utilization deacetylase AcuC-like enzyme
MLKVAWNPIYVLPLPPHHRFPMSKYEVLPQQLLHEGTISHTNIFHPGPIEMEWVLLAHEQEYVDKLMTLSLSPKEIRRTGFPLDRRVVEREMYIMDGTLQCARYALQYGIAMNIAGGTHHAFTNRGEGFCLLNDIAIAANFLLKERLVEKILVVDLDVHQGDGTAQIFRDDPRVFTFSMHGANNYPLQKETSDLDIALPDGTDDKPYLETLEQTLRSLLQEVNPGFIFFQSGVDILATDKLGKLNITRDGCKQRDRIVLQAAHQNNIPLVASMGGGYSQDFRDIIEAHANTFRLAQQIFF